MSSRREGGVGGGMVIEEFKDADEVVKTGTGTGTGVAHPSNLDFVKLPLTHTHAQWVEEERGCCIFAYECFVPAFTCQEAFS